MEISIQEFLEEYNIPMIGPDVNYWFVRTNGGEYFDRFFFDNYIAIEWDELSNIERLRNEESDDVIRDEIKKLYPKESRPGLIVTYFRNFINLMKPGDIILVPNKNSEKIAFGKITSDVYVHTPDFFDQLQIEEDAPALLKRRDVEWFHNHPLDRKQIDPHLLTIIYAHNTIVDANPYKNFINRTLYDIYYTNDELHAIFRVRRRENVHAVDIMDFINTVFDTARVHADNNGTSFSKRDLSIKASINSPGPIELISSATAFLIALAAISMYVNGAKIDFKAKMFGTELSLNIDTPGKQGNKAEEIEDITEALDEAKKRLDI